MTKRRGRVTRYTPHRLELAVLTADDGLEPLDRLARAVALAAALDDRMPELVAACRAKRESIYGGYRQWSEATWDEIGEVLGVSRQAAIKRYGADEPRSASAR